MGYLHEREGEPGAGKDTH